MQMTKKKKKKKMMRKKEFANEGFTLFDGFKEGMRGSKKSPQEKPHEKIKKTF